MGPDAPGDRRTGYQPGLCRGARRATVLLLKDYKGKDADQPVYKVDTRLLAELRAHEKQAAEELGQWSEKRELTGDALQNEITIRFIRPGEALSTPA